MSSNHTGSNPSLVRHLIESVQKEEAILERLISGAQKGETETILAAANEFVAQRAGAKSENCAA